MSGPIRAAQRHGHGPVRVVAVTGWMADHRLFRPCLPWVDPERFDVALLDARGYGTRRDATGPQTVEGIAEDVLACAASLGWERFHVIGHSMAGMAAQRLLIDAPERILSAILLAPVPASGARIDADRRRLLEAAIRDPAARLRLIDANTGGVRPAEWSAELCELSLSGTRPDVLAAYMDSWTGPGFAGELRPVDTPVRVIIGDLDPGASEERLRETIGAWFADFDLRVVAGCGHYPMWEAPERLVALLCDLLPAA
jgi:pimeloyl-ACP methyl ester carboxylesterase